MDGNLFKVPFKGREVAEFVQNSTFAIRIMGAEKFRQVSSNKLFSAKGEDIRGELVERFQAGVEKDDQELFGTLSFTSFVMGLKIWDDAEAFERFSRGEVTSDWSRLSLAHFAPKAGGSTSGVGGRELVTVGDLTELTLWLNNLEWTLMWLAGRHFKGVTGSAREKLLPVQDSPFLDVSADYLRFKLEVAFRKFAAKVRKGESGVSTGGFLKIPAEVAKHLQACFDAALADETSPNRVYPHSLWLASELGWRSIVHPEFGSRSPAADGKKRTLDPVSGLTSDGGGKGGVVSIGAGGGGGGGGDTTKLPCPFRLMEIGKIKAPDGSKVSCTERKCKECAAHPKLSKLTEVTKEDATKVAKALRKKTTSSGSTKLKALVGKMDELVAKATWKP